MTFLRHASRHIHHSVAGHIETQLVALGWTTPGEVPFGASPIVVKRTAGAAQDVETGQVRISLGDEQAPDPEELGGPLTSQQVPIFIDIFMDSDGLAVALACDVRDILLGRIGGKRHIPVVDQATDAAVPGWLIELDDVIRVVPDHVLAMSWQVVKVTAVTYFPEAVY